MLMAILFLPGTIIHEFSHAVMAKLLFVHVGKMELMPELTGESLKLGSVEVGKTDIFRNFFIGIAPFIVGTSIVLSILFYIFSKNLIGLNIFTFCSLLITFIISNTMYSSKKDMEGAIEFFAAIVVPLIILYFLGVRIPGQAIQYFQSSQIEFFFKTASLFLGVPIILDIAIILFAKIITRR